MQGLQGRDVRLGTPCKVTWGARRNNLHRFYTQVSLRARRRRYWILLGRSQTNVQKIATEAKKVLGLLQEECCCVHQHGEHRDVPTIFREGARLHAWLSSPSLGSGRRKTRSQEFWAKWKNSEDLSITQGCAYLFWWIHLTGDERMYPYRLFIVDQ